jgi:hypothetical protein
MQIGRGVWRKRTPLSTPDGYLTADPGEQRVMELKLALAHWIWTERIERSMSQAELGELVGSNQARISRLELAVSSVSLDFYIRVAVALGTTDQQLARQLDLTRSGRVQQVRVWATRRTPQSRIV